MKQSVQLIFAILIVLSIGACTPLTPAAQEPEPTQKTATAEPYYPVTTRTGIETIDQVLIAVARDDQESLRSLVEFTNAQCTQQDGLGGPPKCRAGETDGTPVEVLSFLGSEGSFLRKDEIGSWTGIAASGIYAVYEVNTSVLSSEQYYPVGKYVILFAAEENQPAAALRIGERGIVRVDTIFDSAPESLRGLVEREASTVILAPKS